MILCLAIILLHEIQLNVVLLSVVLPNVVAPVKVTPQYEQMKESYLKKFEDRSDKKKFFSKNFQNLILFLMGQMF